MADRFYRNIVQGGETYNRWHAYGQSKTAVHLYALYLGKLLGKKAQVFGLDPGVIITPLGGHVDWAGEFGDISELLMYGLKIIQLY